MESTLLIFPSRGQTTLSTTASQLHRHHSITACDSQVHRHHRYYSTMGTIHSTTGPFIVSQLERLMGCFIVFAIKTLPPLGHWIWIIWIISMGYYVHCPHLRLNGSFQRQSQTLSKPDSYIQFGNPSFLLQKLMPLSNNYHVKCDHEMLLRKII